MPYFIFFGLVFFYSATTFGQVEQEISAQSIPDTITQESRKRLKCYNDYLKTRPTDTEGSVIIAFRINTEGTVDYARVAKTTFSNAFLPSCIATLVRGLKFSKPTEAVLTKFTFLFANRKSKENRGNVTQVLNPFATHQSSINECIRKTYKKRSPDSGKLVVRLSVKNKKIQFIRKVWSTFEKTVDDCIISAIEKWELSGEASNDLSERSVPFGFKRKVELLTPPK